MGLSHEYAWTFVKCTFRTYGMLLKILPFALHTSPLSVHALQTPFLTVAVVVEACLPCQCVATAVVSFVSWSLPSNGSCATIYRLFCLACLTTHLSAVFPLASVQPSEPSVFWIPFYWWSNIHFEVVVFWISGGKHGAFCLLLHWYLQFVNGRAIA
jgi:hypothetical protein